MGGTPGARQESGPAVAPPPPLAPHRRAPFLMSCLIGLRASVVATSILADDSLGISQMKLS